MRTLEAAVATARANDATATFIVWLMVLRMPLEVTDVEEALEDLELVLEETESVDDPFGELVVAYQGWRHEPAGTTEYQQQEALNGLEAWLT